KTFSLYINEYRIKAACELLRTHHQFTLEGIGYEVGFRSKSNFYASFKKLKGCTPSQFVKAQL
ncbi:MAG: helix-turn-helix domain-containing protein, partial [Bacteroidota bacterium]